MSSKFGRAARALAAAAGLTLTLTAAPADAARIAWTVQNAFFDDGVTLTGGFVFDTALGVFSDLDLRTGNGAVLAGAYLGDPITQFGGQPPILFDTVSGFVGIGEQGLVLVFGDLLDDPSKIVAIQEGVEGLCVDAACADPPASSRALLTGASVAAAAVPAPLGLPLALTGAAVFGLVARRRRRTA